MPRHEPCKGRSKIRGGAVALIAAVLAIAPFDTRAVTTAPATQRQPELSQDATGAPPPKDLVAQSCGPLALSKALSLKGLRVDPLRCAKLAGTDTSGVTSLAGMREAASSLGAETKAMRLTPDSLALLNSPAILRVSLPGAGDHYLVFSRYADGAYEVTDPTRSTVSDLISADQLRLMWAGESLVFAADGPARSPLLLALFQSRNRVVAITGAIAGVLLAFSLVRRLLRPPAVGGHRPIAGRRLAASVTAALLVAVVAWMVGIRTARAAGRTSPRSPLVVSSTVLDVGEIEYGRGMRSQVWVGNRGSSPVELRPDLTRVSCSCLQPSLPHVVLAPGAKASMIVRIHPALRGPLRHTILVRSSQKDDAGQLLVVQGEVEGPGGTFYPPRCYFGRVPRGAAAATCATDFVVQRPGVAVLSAESDRSYVSAAVAPAETGFRVTLTAHDPPGPGFFEGTLTVVTNDPKPEYQRIRIPFKGLVD